MTNAPTVTRPAQTDETLYWTDPDGQAHAWILPGSPSTVCWIRGDVYWTTADGERRKVRGMFRRVGDVLEVEPGDGQAAFKLAARRRDVRTSRVW